MDLTTPPASRARLLAFDGGGIRGLFSLEIARPACRGPVLAGLYRQIVGQLKEKRAQLVESKCRTTAAAVVASCERLLLTELWEWAGTRGRKV